MTRETIIIFLFIYNIKHQGMFSIIFSMFALYNICLATIYTYVILPTRFSKFNLFYQIFSLYNIISVPITYYTVACVIICITYIR